MTVPTLACLRACESISMKLRVSLVVTEELPLEWTSGKKNLQPLRKRATSSVFFSTDDGCVYRDSISSLIIF